ncbi:LRR domain containing protein [Trema orientale]|uniref:LRR domain containing protein n=1 Tax=Trema orientale TaxID=63057 RepID=A0A2P5EP28_TREOI|nr:LRR domain containing protein [Trema orientale]
MGWFSLLSLVVLLFYSESNHCLSLSSSSPSPLCHPDESTALLQFKRSFSVYNLYTPDDYCYGKSKTNSWKDGTNCCTWTGVTCEKLTGHVISLDVACSGLEGILHPNNSLFSLSHLRTLILSDNHFDGSPFSSQFGKFTHLTHLDLSSSLFSGHVPFEIAHLSKLI